MDFELSKTNIVFEHPVIALVYIVIFALAMIWMNIVEIHDKERFGIGVKVIASVIITGITGTFAIVIFGLCLNISKGILSSNITIPDEAKIQKNIIQTPSYLDKHAQLLVEKTVQDGTGEIVTSVYAKDRPSKGSYQGTYIVRTVTKTPGKEEQENYLLYKGDSLELQNKLKRMGFDLSKD